MEGKALSCRMKKRFSFFVPITICLVGISMPLSIGKESPFKIKITASVFPLMEFARAVSGERGEVDLLLPPGAEIHTWQPKPSDLVKLSSADLFIFIGADLEPWIDDILRSVKNPKLRILEASKNLSVHNHDRGVVDPHVWLDFDHDQRIVDRITGVLSEIDPGGLSVFNENAAKYKRKLQELDDKYKKGLEQCDQRTIVLGGHAAFGYLAERYKLRQISLYGLSPDSKPTPRQLIDIVELVKKERIKVIYFEVNVSSDLAKVIAEETGARTLVLNPGASLSRKQMESGISFLNIMEKNLETLIDGLSCR